jgi:hypothetical protein
MKINVQRNVVYLPPSQNKDNKLYTSQIKFLVMKKIYPILFLIPVIFSCSSVKITSDYDKEVDFTKYKSLSYYGWAKESDKILNEFDKQRIEGAFATEFMNRGIELKQSGGDIVVSLFIVVDQKTGTTAYTTHLGTGGWGYGPGWGWGMGYSTTNYHQYDYLVGTLVCDVFDAKTKKLVWEGVVSGEVDENPNNRERNIPRVVRELMKRYPVQPITK